MAEQGDNKTPIGELGKFRLIDHLTGKIVSGNKSTVSGIGDDSTVIENGSLYTLVSTDLLLEGIHFNLTYTPLKHLGYKAVIRGISDIYAMNGRPKQILISLGISTRFSVEDMVELYDGIRMACEKYGTDIAGGDTTSSLTGLTIGVTAVGSVEKEKLVRRSGALPNDLICITGDFGASYMGLQLLERERKIFKSGKGIQPDLSGYEYVIARQLKPEFPAEVIEDLSKNGVVPTSMIDVSDGLASDLLHICRLSGTGCRIYADKIPVDQETFRLAEEFRIDPVTGALNGGEDYELLFTVPLEMFEKVSSIRTVRIIGHITPADQGKVLVTSEGSETELTAQGWEGQK
jgi:thiamine-monophosphate kinase